MQKILKELKNKILDPKHLVSSHDILAPRTPEKYRKPTSDAIPAGVLICLYQKEFDDDFYFSLIKRRTVKEDKHSGQVSLPGGRYEEEDQEIVACALRETEEEIGIPREKVTIVGELSELFVYASNFIVYPFVGVLKEEVPLVPDPREVQHIIEVSLNHLIEPKTVKYTDMKLSEGTLKNVPYYDINGEVVWGATAMILSEFISYWKSAL